MSSPTLPCPCGSTSIGERFSVHDSVALVCGKCGLEGRRGNDEAQARQFWNAMVVLEHWEKSDGK